jgi:hypothetical protein
MIDSSFTLRLFAVYTAKVALVILESTVGAVHAPDPVLSQENSA